MTLVYDDGATQLLQGDAGVVLQSLPDESVDLLVTDPPYGISFLGREWDKALPPVGIWRECLRVLKPGSFAFVMCGPRQDCLARMILSMSEAGFEVGFTSIYWVYATGFPKATNISKAVDKRLGAKRPVVGTKLGLPGYSVAPEANPGGYSGMRYDPVKECAVTGSASNEAKQLDGAYAGFQPKPAVEVILVAMKPLSEESYTDQAMKDGKGVTWLDDCKIPYSGDADKAMARPGGVISTNVGSFPGIHSEGNIVYRPNESYQPTGRFPANLLVSDDALNDGATHSTSKMNAGTQRANRQGYSGPMPAQTGAATVPDSGSYSRYFDLDAWWEQRVSELPESVQRTFPAIICPKAAPSERNTGCDNLPDTRTRNHHPTVKPVKLMSYLVTLGSRPGDVVLDPFAGSGTTGIAAMVLDRRAVLVELAPDYCEIAVARLSHTWLSRCGA